MSALDLAFKEVADNGLYFASLYQKADFTWACGLRGAQWRDAYPYGYGKTPVEAVREAIKKARENAK